jgi:flotillin
MSSSLLPILILAAVLAVSMGGMLLVIRLCLRVVPPDSVIVVQGRSYHGRAFKVVSSSRVLVMPVIEQATVLSLAPRPVTVEIDGWLTQDQQELRLTSSVFVSVLSREPEITNAVERFLGRPDEDIVRVARETLEGTWRQVAADAPAEHLIADLERTRMGLESAAGPELAKLGLGLLAFERFRIQDGSGKTHEGGFDRQRTAEVARRARGPRAGSGARRY